MHFPLRHHTARAPHHTLTCPLSPSSHLLLFSSPISYLPSRTWYCCSFLLAPLISSSNLIALRKFFSYLYLTVRFYIRRRANPPHHYPSPLSFPLSPFPLSLSLLSFLHSNSRTYFSLFSSYSSRPSASLFSSFSSLPSSSSFSPSSLSLSVCFRFSHFLGYADNGIFLLKHK